MNDRQHLQLLEERIYTLLCGGGYLMRAETDEVESLRKKVGETWDAACRKWRPLEPGGYVDRLGYAVCAECGGSEREGAKWYAASNLRGTTDDHSAPGVCDRCQRVFAD